MNSILTAKTEEGKLIVLTPELERERLRKWRKLRLFFCPQCNFPVQLKVGDITIPHFAHLKDSVCTTLFSEGESHNHLQGKQQLYGFFQKYAQLVELEPFLKTVSQRPDILVTTKSESIPIEFQCSTIPVTDIESRSAGYRSIEMKPIWILHTPAKFSTLPVGVGTFYFSRFHESFLTHTSPEGYLLLTYNPQTERFRLFHQSYPCRREALYRHPSYIAFVDASIPFCTAQNPIKGRNLSLCSPLFNHALSICSIPCFIE